MPSKSELLGRSCRLTIFCFTVASILDNVHWARQPRSYDVGEFWAGVGSVARSATAQGLRAFTVEKEDAEGQQQDLLTEAGFLLGVERVMQLKPGGLLVMGPVCSSWVFANTANTGRTRHNWAGNSDYEPVATGNLTAQIACFFLYLCVAREVHAVIENPAGSMLFSYLRPHLAPLRFLSTVCTPRCAFSSEALGLRFLKKFKFLATGTWVQSMARECPCQGLGHAPLMSVDAQGRRTGIAEAMRQSQAYPVQLGAAMIHAWQAAGSSHSFGEILDSMPAAQPSRSLGFRACRFQVEIIRASLRFGFPTFFKPDSQAQPWRVPGSRSPQQQWE